MKTYSYIKSELKVMASMVMLAMVCSEASAAALDEACNAYNQRSYSDALKKLDALPAAQRGAKASYYRGLTLQALHRYVEANTEYRKVALQKQDLRLAAMARQGMIGLSRMPKQSGFHESITSSPGTAAVNSGQKIVEGGNWKVVEPGYGAQGENKHGMPETWTYVKTSNGCGRH